MLQMTKKRYTDRETYIIAQWMRKQGIKSQWVNIYFHCVSNVQIVEHLVKLFNDKYATGPIPAVSADIKGLKNVINL